MNVAQEELHSKEEKRKMLLEEWEESAIAVKRQHNSEAALQDNYYICDQNEDNECESNLPFSPSLSSSRTSAVQSPALSVATTLIASAEKSFVEDFPLTIVTRLTSSTTLYHDGDDFLGRTGDDERGTENEKSWGIHCRHPLRGVVAKQRLRKFTPIHILPQAVANMREEYDRKTKKKNPTLLSSSFGDVPFPYKEESSFIHFSKSSSEAEVGDVKDSLRTVSSQCPLVPPVLLNRLLEPSSTHITLRCFLALRHCWKSGAYFHIPTWNGWYLLAPSWAIPTQLSEGVHTKWEEGCEQVSETIVPITATSSSGSPSVQSSSSSSLQKRGAGEEVVPFDRCGIAFRDEAAVRLWCHRLHPRYGGPNTRALERQKKGENEEDPYYELQEFRNEKAKELYFASGAAAWEKSALHPHHGHGNQMKGIEREIYDPNLWDEQQREGAEEQHSMRKDKKRKRSIKKQNMKDTPLYIPEQHLFELNDGIQWPLLNPILLEVMICIFDGSKASVTFSSSLPSVTNTKEMDKNVRLDENASLIGTSAKDMDLQDGCDSSTAAYGVDASFSPLRPTTPGKRIRTALSALLQFFRRHLQRLEVYDNNGGGWSREEEDLFVQESLSAWETLRQHVKRMGPATPHPTASTTFTSTSGGSATHTSPLTSITLSMKDKGERVDATSDGHQTGNAIIRHETSSMPCVLERLSREGEGRNSAVVEESPSPSVFFPRSQGNNNNTNHPVENKGRLHVMPTEEEVVAHSRRLFRAYTQKANCQLVISDDHSIEGGEEGPSLSLPAFSKTSSPLLTLVPLEDISEGEELTLHYGREWWTEHFLYPLLLLREIVRDWKDYHRLHLSDPSIMITDKDPLKSSLKEQQTEEIAEPIHTKKSSASSSTSSSSSIVSFLMKEIQEIERQVALPEDVFEPFPILRLSLLNSAKKTKKRAQKRGSGELSSSSVPQNHKDLGHDGHASRKIPPALNDVSMYQLRNVSTKQRFSSPSAVVAVAVQQSVLDPSWLHDSLIFSSVVQQHTVHFSDHPSSGVEKPETSCKGNDASLSSCRVFDLQYPDQLVPISRLREALKRRLLQQQREVLSPTLSPSSLKEEGECEKLSNRMRKEEKRFDNLSSLYSTVLQRWGPSTLAFR